jgi:hypothetical protein
VVVVTVVTVVMVVTLVMVVTVVTVVIVVVNRYGRFDQYCGTEVSTMYLLQNYQIAFPHEDKFFGWTTKYEKITGHR